MERTSCANLDGAGFWRDQRLSFIPPLEGHLLVIENLLVIVLAYFSGRTIKVPTSRVTWVLSEMNFSSPGHAAEHGI